MGGRTLKVNGFQLAANASEVKEFIEGFTGDGSVYALKFRLPKVIKLTSRAYVVVQFSAIKHAAKITSMAQNRLLRYKGFLLTVRNMERDIVPKPRTSLFVVDDIKMHFGNQISKERFSILWTAMDVRVQFGFNMRKIYIFLSIQRRSYKLELSYESIWEIQLRSSPNDENSQLLLIQVQAAPRIYELPLRNSALIYEDCSLNYFREIPDDQWVRTTDFTPSCSIGQSSALCLELPCICDLPNISDYFFYYKQDGGDLHLDLGASFSRSSDLVPIVEPSHGIEVPYRILFKINHMVQHGILNGPTLDDMFFNLVSPNSVRINYIDYALEKMSYLKSTCFNPAKWLREQYAKFQLLDHKLLSPTISLDDGLVYVHRVQVTPVKIYFYGPELIISNPVLRNYSEDLNNFLRISFVDEDCERMHSTDLAPRYFSTNEKRTSLYGRILSTLRNGITIGNKKFEFLGFSSSQLRESSAWMFSSRRGLTASDIRKWMGDFHKIRNVAKYAARLGQSFSSSTETVKVKRHDVEVIPDIENAAGHVFSDGIGKISVEFARRVTIKCGLKSSTPSAFQIRYGGYKGVVAVDPTSAKKLSLRESMSKYPSENDTFDVLAYSKNQPCYLNRQLITLLSTLGVKDHIFEHKQKQAIGQLDSILTDPTSAMDVLETIPGETTNAIREMLLCGYKPDTKPFLSMMLQTFRATKLQEIRSKSRIFIPKGRAMMGCLDETRTLEYGQVFVQFSCSGTRQLHNNNVFAISTSESDRGNVVLKGRVIVAKNPCLHPGDIRILLAVDVPKLHHMIDCVVFPQKGKRPHPHECSGSDLDGDIYFVSWDSELVPPREAPPMDYIPAPAETLDHEVTIEEIQEYFTNYIVNDGLGIIANAHTVLADKEPQKAESEACIQLAKLFSIAVDFPKTGVAAEIPPHLHVKEYPDFMEKFDRDTYESKGVIGKLFRSIKDHKSHSAAHIKAFTKEVAVQSYDQDMEVDGFEELIEDAIYFKEVYDFKLGNLMEHYGIKTEAEILSGSVMKVSKSFNKFKDGDALLSAVRSLRKEARSWFEEKSNEDGDDDLYAKASAWYHVTYHPDYWGSYNKDLNRPHFLSFPWCVYDKLIEIKQEKARRKKPRCCCCCCQGSVHLPRKRGKENQMKQN